MEVRKREVKREGARELYPIIFIYLFIFTSTHTVSTDSCTSTASRFTATTATTPMRPSTSQRTECVDNYPHSITSLTFPCTRIFFFPSGYTHIFHLFLTTLPLLFSSSIVRRYVLIVCTDERKSRVDQLYSQRRGARKCARALAPKLPSHFYPHSNSREK